VKVPLIFFYIIILGGGSFFKGACLRCAAACLGERHIWARELSGSFAWERGQLLLAQDLHRLAWRKIIFYFFFYFFIDIVR
jgi:hypothetical protein